MRRWLCALLLALAAWSAHAQSVDRGSDARSVLLMLRLPADHYRPDAAYGGAYAGAGQASRRRLARTLAREHGLSVREEWPMPALGVDCFVLAAADADAAARAVDALARDSRVESAQAMQLFHTLGDPLAAVQPANARWHLDELHRHATGRGVRVAVIDSGVAASHPDLRGQVALSRNFVDARPEVAEAHGTQVAGVIAARAGNGIGIAGVAPEARLLALRACWESARATAATCSSFTLARALQFAIDARAPLVNLSLAGPHDVLLARLLDVALRRGIVVVAAAQAEGDFPASHPGVVAVSADEAAVAGTWRAPGRGIPTTTTDGAWTMVDGPSFAAAEVTGLLADLRQHASRASDLRLALGTVHAASRGIDACAALQRVVRRGCVCNCAIASATMDASQR